MLPMIRSELRKFFTTRLWWGMAVGIFLAGAAFATLFGFLLTSEAALAANTVQAALDNDEALRPRLAKAKPDVQEKTVDLLLERKGNEAVGMLANVTAGWMNLGAGASAALLGRAQVPTMPRPTALAAMGFQKGFWLSGADAVWPPHLFTRLVLALVVGVVLMFIAQRIFDRLQRNFVQEL